MYKYSKRTHTFLIFWYFPALIGVILLFPLTGNAVGEAALFLNPASGSFFLGSTFDVSIVLDTKSRQVNMVEVELQFPSDKLQLASPSVGQSIIQLWPAPPVFSNREGKIYFAGGIPSPGVVTSQGIVLTLTFRVIGPGEGQIRFDEKTRVLANDGKGTDILGQHSPAFFRFLVPPPQGPVISSPTHPDQERWYRDPNPVFVWQENYSESSYSYSIDHDPSGFPDTTAESSAPTAAFQNLENGIWYFHLREQAQGVWGGVSHYVIKIDNEPSAAFRINISPARRTTNRNPIFRFFTTDALSGFSHYEMKMVPLSGSGVSDALFFEITSPYQAVNMETGRYQVIIRALDYAGNTRDEMVTLNIVGSLTQFINPEGIDLIFIFIPWWMAALMASLIFTLFIILLIALWIKHKHHLHHAFREDVRRVFRIFRKNPPTT